MLVNALTTAPRRRSGRGYARVAVALLGAALSAGCASGTGPSSDRIVLQDADGAEVAFNDRDRERIRDYYGSNLPPGLAKGQRLPHGLHRQVERGGRLPPGLEGQPIPADLQKALSELPEGYRRVRVGADVVLMERETRLVIDVIHDVGLIEPYGIDIDY